jgi:alpha-glucosidase
VRDLIRFRYRMIPYLYNLMVEAHRSGSPIIRPLVYHFPDDPLCWNESFDFLLGAHLLVASVLEAGARSRRVYLPQGSAWCDFYSGRWYEGGQEIEVDAPLERIPLLVADGGMIPLGPVMRFVGAAADDSREVHVFARSSTSMMLYEDDGATFAHRDGQYTILRLSLSLENGQFVPTIDVLQAGYPLAYDRVTFIVATDSPYPVANGVYEDGRWRVTVPVPRFRSSTSESPP